MAEPGWVLTNSLSLFQGTQENYISQLPLQLGWGLPGFWPMRCRMSVGCHRQVNP